MKDKPPIFGKTQGCCKYSSREVVRGVDIRARCLAPWKVKRSPRLGCKGKYTRSKCSLPQLLDLRADVRRFMHRAHIFSTITLRGMLVRIL